MSLPLYDAHNHLQDARLHSHLASIIASLETAGLRATVVNGTGEADWDAVLELALRHRWVRPSLGLHPWLVSERSPKWQARLLDALERAGPGAGIGEIGLDKWIRDYDLAAQTEVFVWQLRLAAERDLPVSVHCLQAWGALADVLRREPVPNRGFLIHAYGGPAEMVGPFAKRGAYFSFNGSMLEERKAARREIFRHIPLERLLVETDAPDMPPPPERRAYSLPECEGKPVNHPANIATIYEALAAIRETPVETLAAAVEGNFRALFG